MSAQTEGKALIEQTVSVDLIVHIEAREADMTMLLDDLRDRLQTHVAGFLPKDVFEASADIEARRGSSGYRYFPPGAERATDSRAIKPLTVTLTDLGYKES